MDRKTLGRKAGIAGIFGNLVLFFIKFFAGSAANSIAVIADSFNNLLDGSSSLITIIGFQASGRARDEKHPFGHGRMEYICGFLIALMILGAACSLGLRSLKRLLEPETVAVSAFMFLVPLSSVLIKSCLIAYTVRINRMLDSPALRASIRESYADMLITLLTVVTLLTAPVTAIPVDAIAGMIIAVFILWSGLTALSENMDLLLGRRADDSLQREIRTLLLSYPPFQEMLSLYIHDYGPDQQFAVIQVRLSVPVPSEGELEGALREAGERLRRDYGLHSVIYWRPECGICAE